MKHGVILALLVSEREETGDRGAPRPGAAEQGAAPEARSRTSSTCSPRKWTLDGTLAVWWEQAEGERFCGAAAAAAADQDAS